RLSLQTPAGPIAFAQRMHGALVVDTHLDRTDLVVERGHEAAAAPLLEALAAWGEGTDAMPEPPTLELVEAPAETYLRAVEQGRRYV
ncbi:aminodeoxychorismate synthase, component I, partial [Enterococcus hirae]